MADIDVDLLVIGGGSAGAAAAIAGADLGARVLVVEKTASLGGNSRYSAGNLWSVTGPLAMDHMRALSFDKTPDDVLEAYLSGLDGLRHWLAEHGATTELLPPHALPACWPNFPGAEAVEYYAVPGDHGSGPALWAALSAALERLPIDTMTNTSLDRLVTTGDAVTGAELRHADGGRSRVSAGAVVLATGGFENSRALLDAYLPLPDLVPVGHDGNTGDGMRAASAVGAAVWHMSTFFGFWAYQPPAPATAYPLLFLGRSYLMVDSDGRRFHAEAGHEAHDALRPVGEFLPNRPNRPHLPAYAIFDDAMLARAPLGLFPSPNPRPWSHDNSAEVTEGWISEAASTGELAERLGLPGDELTASVAAFNAAATNGHDDDFARPAPTMSPLAGQRLYGIRVWPGVATTSGGPRRDGRARVLREDGTPIPGLYAAGNTGSVWGHLTQHGGGLTDGLVFGPIAARDALTRSAGV